MKIIIRNKGGFGNQLFIYAFYLYLKDKKPDSNIIIENFSGFFRNRIVYPHIQTNKPLLKKYFKIKSGGVIDTLIVYVSKFNIRYFKILDIAFFDGDNLLLENINFKKINVIEGYFQNYEIFEVYLKKVKIILNKLNKAEKSKIKYKNIALQVRANDYNFKISVEYIKQALTLFENSENTQIYIFSDNIKWCKNNLMFLKNINFIKTGNDIDDLFILSKFDKIILTIGTYGWWGSFLGSDNKIVVYPKNNSHPENFYPKKWLKI